MLMSIKEQANMQQFSENELFNNLKNVIQSAEFSSNAAEAVCKKLLSQYTANTMLTVKFTVNDMLDLLNMLYKIYNDESIDKEQLKSSYMQLVNGIDTEKPKSDKILIRG